MLARSAAVSLVLLVVACGGAEPSAENVEGAEANLTPTRVGSVESLPLPIAEVSGLGQRRVGSKTQYLAIGDASTSLITFSTAASGGQVTDIEQHDLSSLFHTRESQWESVAGDASGNVYLLAEAKSTITVVDKGLSSIMHTMKLTMPADHPLAGDWADDENSRGEGMVLLSNGHVILAKEKKPSALIEFAPRGEAPAGYNASLALGTRAFPLPSGATSELVATKHWLLKDKDARWMSDVSDLSIDHENRLLLLSDQGRAIARIERTLSPDEDKIDIKVIFELPSHVDKPEGLTFANGKPVVATDGKNTSHDCLYELEALP